MVLPRCSIHRQKASNMYPPSRRLVPAVALTGLISAVVGLDQLRTDYSDPLVLAQSISDCGTVSMVMSEAEMRKEGSRIHAIEIEIVSID